MKKKNVVLIILDSLRRDIMKRSELLELLHPHVYYDCIAPSNHTYHSIPSILTGHHLIELYNPTNPLILKRPLKQSFFSRFERFGYEVDFISTKVPYRPKGDYFFPEGGYIPRTKHNFEYYYKTKKSFAIVYHIWDTHYPYTKEEIPVKEIRDKIRENTIEENKQWQLYGLNHAIKNRIKPILDGFTDGKNLDDTLFVFTADHAESMGEEGRYLHGGFCPLCNHCLDIFTIFYPVIKKPFNGILGGIDILSLILFYIEKSTQISVSNMKYSHRLGFDKKNPKDELRITDGKAIYLVDRIKNTFKLINVECGKEVLEFKKFKKLEKDYYDLGGKK